MFNYKSIALRSAYYLLQAAIAGTAGYCYDQALENTVASDQEALTNKAIGAMTLLATIGLACAITDMARNVGTKEATLEAVVSIGACAAEAAAGAGVAMAVNGDAEGLVLALPAASLAFLSRLVQVNVCRKQEQSNDASSELSEVLVSNESQSLSSQ